MKNRKTRSAMRRMLFTLALVLVVAVASVGGTIAWLTASTAPVTNTFTVGDINITLTETTGNDYKIIPGTNLEKDPTVTVKKGSEDCWVFVKVEEDNWPNNIKDGEVLKVRYEVDTDAATGWKKLNNVDGVYYREVSASEVANADKSFAVLKTLGGQNDNPAKNYTIIVSNTLTKDDIKGITTNPTLKFTAYAIQKEGTGTVAEAWAKIGA